MNLITYNNLTAGEMSIIDQYDVTKDPNTPRNISDVDLITATWVDCPRIATLEFHRHFMDNNMDVLFGDDDPSIEITDRQFMDTVLGLCTACMNHLTIEQ